MIVNFKEWVCNVIFTEYHNNSRVAILLVDSTTGEQVATATLNTDADLKNDEVIIKDYSENTGMLQALMDAGIISAPIGIFQTGYVRSPVCKLLVEPFQDEDEPDNDIIVQWVAYEEEFTTFEFSGPILHQDGNTFDLFRLFLWKDGKEEIMVANREDYDIHEDMTAFLPLDKIVAACLASEPDVDDATEDYKKHYAERSEV